MHTVSWSNDLESTAQSWANNCNFAHSGLKGVGENIYISMTSNQPKFDATKVVKSWYDEVRKIFFLNLYLTYFHNYDKKD
jgi:hypothetical protein